MANNASLFNARQGLTLGTDTTTVLNIDGTITSLNSTVRGKTAATAVALFDTSTGNINLGGAGSTLVVQNLTVNGTTTTINSTTISVDDANIELGSVVSPTDVTANGGGITLKGATDKTIIWDSGNANWTSSENWNLTSGKTFKINNVSVLSGSELGSGITGSSLTSVGTLTGGTWNANAIVPQYGGTGSNLSATGGANKVLMQTSVGGNITVAQLAAANLSDGTTGSGNIVLATAPQFGSSIGIGVAANTDTGALIQTSSLSGANQYGAQILITSTSGATASIRGLNVQVGTAATTFTTMAAYGAYFYDAVKGSGSTITSQYGIVIADQTKGTNNYGIVSSVSSGSNKWNIYADGTADNYFAGKTYFGSNANNDTSAIIESASSGSNGGVISVRNSGITNGYLQIGYDTTGPFFYEREGTKSIRFFSGAAERLRLDSSGSAIFKPDGTNTVATISTAGISTTGTFTNTGDCNLGVFASNSTKISGYLGVGGAGSSDRGIFVTSSALAGAWQLGVDVRPVFTSAATSGGYGVVVQLATASASFTQASLYNIYCDNAIKGAGSTIINQHGVYINDLTVGTINYGITSTVSSGSNKWNIYASGTADNYFAGNTYFGSNIRIGSTVAPTVALDVTGSALFSGTINKVTLTAPSTSATITIANNAIFTVNNTITLAGTDFTTITLPSTTGTVALNNQTMYIGTTAVAINRASAALTLTGCDVANISGGAGGSIPYQSAANTTAMLANGTAGQVLKSSGGTSAPVWVAPRLEYLAGSGGTVSQASSKATGVTINTLCGKVETYPSGLGGGASVSFLMTNSNIGLYDILAVNVSGLNGQATANAYRVSAQVYNGSAYITLTNVSAGTLSEQVPIIFSVIKGVIV